MATRGNRFAILAAYAIVTASTQMLWLTFAPITTQAASVMHTSVGNVGDLAAVFPFVYIVLALPTGRWLDRQFAKALAAGALLTGAGALLRLFAPAVYGWQFWAQLLVAAGQPVVLNAVNPLATRYFPEKERPLAIALGSVAVFLGILLAMVSGPLLYAYGGLWTLFMFQGIFAAIGAVWMTYGLRSPPAFQPETTPATAGLPWLLKDRFMWHLAALLFIGMGIYNAVATWLEPILAAFGTGAEAGNLLALMTVAGIAGAAFLPPLAASSDRRRTMLVGATTFTGLTFAALAWHHSRWWSAAWLGLDGFLLLACLPVVLEWAELHAGPQYQGFAVGFLMMAGNLGGLVLVVIAQILLHNAYLPLLVLTGFALAGAGLSFGLPGHGREHLWTHSIS